MITADFSFQCYVELGKYPEAVEWLEKASLLPVVSQDVSLTLVVMKWIILFVHLITWISVDTKECLLLLCTMALTFKVG